MASSLSVQYSLFAHKTGSFLLIILAVSILFSGYYHSQEVPVLPQGPTRRVSEVSKSIVNQASLQSPEFKNYLEILRKDALGKGKKWQDVFSLGKNGEIYPKHSLFSCFYGAPFFYFFGDSGFWLAQQVMMIVLAWAIFQITSRLTSSPPVLLCTLSLIFFTPIFTYLYAYVYSYDLHGWSLLLCGTALMPRAAASAAFIIGISLFVRPSNALLFPYLLLIWPWRLKRELGARVLGLSAACLLFFIANYTMYGSPFTTSYSRLPGFSSDGSLILSSHPIGFSAKEILNDLWQKLLGSDKSLVFTCPLWLIFPWVLHWGAPGRDRQFIFVSFAASLTIILYVFSYEYWDTRFMGANRFFMPGTMLFLPAIIAFLHERARRLIERH